MRIVLAWLALCLGFFAVGYADGWSDAKASASPAYCYSTGQWQPFPQFQGSCPDGQAPFNGPGPTYGGGNHRWPDGSDE